MADAPPRREGLTRRALWPLAAAASVAAVSGGLTQFASGRLHTVGTRKGQVRTVTLPDGSVVTLNTDTKIRVRYSAKARAIDLLAGEALFAVQKDAARPFRVNAGRAAATAVGTQYTVRRIARDAARVIVHEGVVELAAPGPNGHERRLAPARSLAVLVPGAPIKVSTLALEALRDELAWRDGYLELQDTPLGTASLEMARYSDPPIVLADASLGRLTVTGRFSNRDPIGFARAVALSQGLAVEVTPDALVLSRP